MQDFDGTTLRDFAGQSRVVEENAFADEGLFDKDSAVVDVRDTTAFIRQRVDARFHRVNGQAFVTPSFSSCVPTHTVLNACIWIQGACQSAGLTMTRKPQ